MKLLSPFHLGKDVINNRIVMAPMTRSRANIDGEVGASTVLYYTQRASAGLIISEAINISKQAIGYPCTPGIYTQSQIQAWKKVTQAVHDNGGKIYAQLWHTGRVGHSLVKHGELPVAPSAIGIQGQKHFTFDGPKDYETPIELTILQIKAIIQEYKQAAIHAIEAGFDGIELHAANGYLPNQFLAESSNQRSDEYGGSIENRNRFVVEIMEEIVSTIGGKKAGIRLSPTNTNNSIIHQNPIEQFTDLINSLNTKSLSYLHIMNVPYNIEQFPQYPQHIIEFIDTISEHPIMANCGYTRETGEEELVKGHAAMISYGKLFIANPDLPKRFELNAELTEVDPSTMYSGQDKGYIDYPFLHT